MSNKMGNVIYGVLVFVILLVLFAGAIMIINEGIKWAFEPLGDFAQYQITCWSGGEEIFNEVVGYNGLSYKLDGKFIELPDDCLKLKIGE